MVRFEPAAMASNQPPDKGGGDVFNRSNLTSRTPPGPQKKRVFSDAVSPTYFSPYEHAKRARSVSPENNNANESIMSNSGDIDYCKIMYEASTYLSKINELVNDQGSRMNISNKSAIMDMTQKVTSIVSLLALKSSSIETQLAKVERNLVEEQKCKPTASNNNSSTSYYADKLKLRLHAKAPQPPEPRKQLPCIIAYPTAERSSDITTSSATKKTLMKAINPREDGFQIVGVKKAAKSGVVLRVSNENQIKKLQSVEAIKTAGLRLEKPKSRRPRIIIRDVPSSLEGPDFLATLYRQNIQGELPITESDFVKNTRIVRRRKFNNDRQWVGIELEPATRNHLFETKEKLFIDWVSCRFFDDLEIVICTHCSQYGHVHKYCTEKSPLCGHCAESHETKECTNKDKPEFKPVCAACKRFKKPCDHKCGTSDCPSYQAKINQLIQNTTY